jgi:azurin
MKNKWLAAICLVFMSFLLGCGSKYDQEILIESMGNQMKYNVVQIKAKKNTTLKITFKNNATMAVMKHNIVVLKPSANIDEIGKAALTAPNNLPSNSGILAATKIVEPGESTDLIIELPNEAGIYPYICTFPGHYQVMQGKIIVE